MASKWINAILWTLVGVNLITLVLGGLVTWLAYTIPVRLKQIGLSPEVTQLAGFASLLVACLGLCALNYSSHYALNAYGLSCSIFLVLMLFGLLPDSWQRVISLNPSSSSSSKNQSVHPVVLSSGASQLASASVKPGSEHKGGILLSVTHFALIVILSALLAFAFILAQYLRQKQRGYVDNHDDSLRTMSADMGQSGGGHSRAWSLSQGRRATGLTSVDCTSPSCTCNLTTQTSSQDNAAGCRAPLMSYANNNGSKQQRPFNDDIEVMRMSADGALYNASAGLVNASGNGQQWARNGATPLTNRSQTSPDRAGPKNSYLSQASIDMDHFLPPLIARGVYRNGNDSQQQVTRRDELDSGGGGRLTPSDRDDGVEQHARFNTPRTRRHRHNHYVNNNNNNSNNDNQRSRNKTPTDKRCRCDPSASYGKTSSAVTTLAAKLNPEAAMSENHHNHHHHQQQQQQQSPYNYNTMPNNFDNLSSVYAIKSAVALRQAMEAKRKRHAAKSSGGAGSSMMAMTAAAAAAALLGGVVDSSLLDHSGGGDINMNELDGLDGLNDDNFPSDGLMMTSYHDQLDDCNFGCGHNQNNHEFTSALAISPCTRRP